MVHCLRVDGSVACSVQDVRGHVVRKLPRRGVDQLLGTAAAILEGCGRDVVPEVLLDAKSRKRSHTLPSRT